MADMSQADESQTDYVALMEEVPTAVGIRLRSCYFLIEILIEDSGSSY